MSSSSSSSSYSTGVVCAPSGSGGGHFGFQPQFTAPAGHPLHLRGYLPPHVTLVALDGRLGTSLAPASGSGNARRIVLDPYVRNATALRLRSVELPLTFTQFSAARGNTVFAVGASAPAGQNFGGAPAVVPDGNYTAESMVAALNATAAATDAELVFTYTAGAGGGPKRMHVTNASSVSRSVLFAVHPNGSMKRELPASQLGWSLGFRHAAYILEPNGGTAVAEAGASMQPLRCALVRLGANPPFLRDGFQAAQAGETVAKVLLPPSELFGAAAESSASTLRCGTVLCATEANGLLQAGTRVFRDTATVANTPAAGAEIRQLDIEILDEFGRPLDLQGDTFSLTLEVTHG